MHRGFTLIELLVVISIISVLSSIVYVSVTGVREQAQAAKKTTEAEQTKKALILYKQKNNSYPGDIGVHAESGEEGEYDEIMQGFVEGDYLGSVPDSPDDSYQYVKIEVDDEEKAFFRASSAGDDFSPNANNCAVDVDEDFLYGPGISGGYHVYGWTKNDPANTFIGLIYADFGFISTYVKNHTNSQGEFIREVWRLGNPGVANCEYQQVGEGETLIVGMSPVPEQDVMCPDVLEEHTPNILEIHELYQNQGGVCTSPGEYCSCTDL